MPDPFDFGRDIDGAYLAQVYIPSREYVERRRWEEANDQPWDTCGADTMLDELRGTSTNCGCGPAWGDLVAEGYFEEDR